MTVFSFRLLLPVAIAICFFSCEQSRPITHQPAENLVAENGQNVYNEALAKELKADDYGMRKYVMAFLKKGPNRTQDSTEAAALQNAHLANIDRLAKEGKLLLAGPFLDDTDLRGIYIFDVESVEEAAKLTETDPAIKAGRLIMELHPWYGSAALMQVNAIHKKLEKKDITKN